jgi:hypothetical protein
MANQVRVVALLPAFALARQELQMAMRATTHPTPHTALARRVQGSPLPREEKVAMLPENGETLAAYVVKT